LGDVFEAQLGERPPEFVEPDAPAVLQWYLGHFNGLSMTRGSGFAAPNRLTYQEILAYQKAMKVKLSPFDIAVVLSIDSIYIHAYAEAHDHSKQQQTQTRDPKGAKKKPPLGKLVPSFLPPGLSMEKPQVKPQPESNG